MHKIEFWMNFYTDGRNTNLCKRIAHGSPFTGVDSLYADGQKTRLYISNKGIASLYTSTVDTDSDWRKTGDIMLTTDLSKDLGTESLNNITSFGDYAQRKANDATIARNYPTPNAGMLEVRPFEGGNWIYQRYTAQNGAIYNRKKYNGSWSDWK